MSLEVKNLTAGYGDVIVLRDVSVHRAAAKHRVPARRQWRRQDHLAECHLRSDGGRQSGPLLDGTDITRMSAHERVEAGSPMCRRAGSSFLS